MGNLSGYNTDWQQQQTTTTTTSTTTNVFHQKTIFSFLSLSLYNFLPFFSFERNNYDCLIIIDGLEKKPPANISVGFRVGYDAALYVSFPISLSQIYIPWATNCLWLTDTNTNTKRWTKLVVDTAKSGDDTVQLKLEPTNIHNEREKRHEWDSRRGKRGREKC